MLFMRESNVFAIELYELNKPTQLILLGQSNHLFSWDMNLFTIYCLLCPIRFNKGGGFCSRGERNLYISAHFPIKLMKKEEPPAF